MTAAAHLPTLLTEAEAGTGEGSPGIVPDYDDDVRECANCGGEGFVYGCSWDWQCDTYDEGEGTCLCTRRCDWCTTPTDAEIAERQAIRKVLGDALRINEGTK